MSALQHIHSECGASTWPGGRCDHEVPHRFGRAAADQQPVSVERGLTVSNALGGVAGARQLVVEDVGGSISLASQLGGGSSLTARPLRVARPGTRDAGCAS